MTMYTHGVLSYRSSHMKSESNKRLFSTARPIGLQTRKLRKKDLRCPDIYIDRTSNLWNTFSPSPLVEIIKSSFLGSGQHVAISNRDFVVLLKISGYPAL
ncbi:hypothetical protein KC19_VG066200 [Ceratodon purpureus]|uniref:Uncharacterized protein n=1 Tax=Ceratodon purpureus TaxID=3225 RepID=A0A8T0HN80_CERPU|nr:hypothetical protein KC19_VG066200 [Ceratodon purpureus]